MPERIYLYRVDFEFLSRSGWQRHSGNFTAPDAKKARAKVLDQLKALGISAGASAVYGGESGETIVLGSPLPLHR